MLRITVPSGEIFDEATSTFTTTKETVLHLEHSLISISKWESKHHKPFLKKQNGSYTQAEIIDYIRCMTINNVSDNVYYVLTKQNIKEITDYINESRTASVLISPKVDNSRETVTSELIYYWMISYNIPFECERWHISRLLMLIRICSAKNSNGKTDRNAMLRNNRALNAARRKRLGTRG